MKWESGRTQRTLLQVVRESKEKWQATSGVLSSVSSLRILYSPTGSILLYQCPTLDNLRNFLLTLPAEMVTFFQQFRKAV